MELLMIHWNSQSEHVNEKNKLLKNKQVNEYAQEAMVTRIIQAGCEKRLMVW